MSRAPSASCAGRKRTRGRSLGQLLLPFLLPLPLVRYTNHQMAGSDPHFLLGRAARRRHREQREEFPPRLFQILHLLLLRHRLQLLLLFHLPPLLLLLPFL